MPRIFLDPGHGGSDRANKGPTGYVEADGALDIGLKLRDILKSRGFEVGMSRDKDISVSLSQRGKMAGNFKADLFLSIHSNAGASNATGTEVYYSVDLPHTKALAAEMSKAVANALGIPDRGAKVRESQNYKGEDYYTVIDTAQDSGVPRVLLIETAFHSNPKEEALLKQPAVRQKIADTLADVICKEFKIAQPAIQPLNASATVNVETSLNVRSGPGTNYNIIGKLSKGQQITITGETGDWYQIKYNNANGFVNKQYVQKEDDTMDKIVVYSGDIDALAAIILGQKLQAPVMRKADFDKSGIKAKEIIQVGGSAGNRFDTFKKAAQLL